MPFGSVGGYGMRGGNPGEGGSIVAGQAGRGLARWRLLGCQLPAWRLSRDRGGIVLSHSLIREDLEACLLFFCDHINSIKFFLKKKT
jgi:hypothetical protein